MRAVPARIFHYTCDHGAAGIRATGILLPHRHPFLGRDILWLTDLATPYRFALGLTSDWITCDRTRHRFEVDPEELWHCLWWPAYAREHVDWSLRDALESAPGVMPAHWWVSLVPVSAVRDTVEA